MSQWTHVAGVIRLDSMGAAMVKGATGVKNEKIEAAAVKALGNTCDFESSPEEHERCNVPSGSEGSLQYRVFPNTDDDNHALSWGYAVIWGDLRDFDAEDVLEIQEWFQKSLERLHKPEGFWSPEGMSEREKAEHALCVFSIRGAILSIDVEGGPQTVLLWDNDARKVVELKAQK